MITRAADFYTMQCCKSTADNKCVLAKRHDKRNAPALITDECTCCDAMQTRKRFLYATATCSEEGDSDYNGSEDEENFASDWEAAPTPPSKRAARMNTAAGNLETVLTFVGCVGWMSLLRGVTRRGWRDCSSRAEQSQQTAALTD